MLFEERRGRKTGSALFTERMLKEYFCFCFVKKAFRLAPFGDETITQPSQNINTERTKRNIRPDSFTQRESVVPFVCFDCKVHAQSHTYTTIRPDGTLLPSLGNVFTPRMNGAGMDLVPVLIQFRAGNNTGNPGPSHHRSSIQGVF